MGGVFLSADEAHAILKRVPRAYSLLEEIKQGNIERECREEICNYEEAHEAFEDHEKTRRFWEEYVRESSPSGGLESVVGGVHSLYLILPLLLVVLLIAAVAITVWRCHTRKRSERSPGMGHSHHDPNLAVVSMDQWGREYHLGDQSSSHSSPAYPGSEVTSGRGSAGNPPPSYDEAVGHADVQIETEPPPKYEDIVNTNTTSVNVGLGK